MKEACVASLLQAFRQSAKGQFMRMCYQGINQFMKRES